MKLLPKVLIPIALLALAACGTLAPGGAYKDKVLYNADLTITTSYDVLHTFVIWEQNNRPVLHAFPEVTKAADYVRANARQWLSSAIALRETYAANPTSENLAGLNKALNVLRTAMTEATKYLIQTQTSNP